MGLSRNHRKEGPWTPIVEQRVSKMSHAEKVRLLGELKAAIAEELVHEAADGRPERCPRCGSPAFVRKGRGRDSSQRWLCRGCSRTFSARTGSLLAQSKLPPATWMEFAECMADMLTLRESARRCGVSLYTSWFMRMRVCEVMAARLAPPREGDYHVDGTYLVKSLKGNHGKAECWKMTRDAHRNGQDGRRGNRSKSQERVCIICGANEMGDAFAVVACEGVPAAFEAEHVVRDRIPAGSRVTVDGHTSYSGLARRFAEVTTVDAGDPSTGHINLVNSLHSRLKKFIARFGGVSTRRLQRYLDWFCYVEQTRNVDFDRREVLYRDEVRGSYIRTRVLTHFETRTMLSYVERRIREAKARKLLGVGGLPLDEALSTVV